MTSGVLRAASALVLMALAGFASCASRPEAPPLTEDAELDAFARDVGRKLEAHAWRDIIGAADPEHYRTQVTEGGMGEPQYVAELFGLYGVENNIRRGERASWADLERIESVELERIEEVGDRRYLIGRVLLRDGTAMDLRATIVERNGRHRLTGGVG